MDRRLIYLLILVATAAILQQIPWLQFAGVRPNWTLAALLLAIFLVRGWVEYLVLVVAAAALLLPLPNQLLISEINSWGGAAAALAATAVAAYLIRQILPWQSFLNYLLLVVLGTAGFYLLLDRAFLISRGPLFFQELLYNLILGAVLFIAVTRIYHKKTGIRI